MRGDCDTVRPLTQPGYCLGGTDSVAGILRVDADSLQADGRALAALGDVPAKEDCPAPAGDPVSSSMAFAFTGHDENLCEELQYARMVREHGGAVVTAAGVMFEVADAHAALQISRVDVGHRPRPVSAAAAAMPVLPPQPKQPPRARIPDVLPQSMGPEEFAEALHSGRGAGRVRDFSAHWRRASDDIVYVGDRTSHVGDLVDEHWPDNSSNAASNIRDHGRWMHNAASWGERLSKAAESAAAAYDYACRDTPSPSEFKDARQNIENQRRFGSPSDVLDANAAYNRLLSRAKKAGNEYYTRIEAALTTVGHPMVPPPLIAKRAVIPHGLVRGPGEWATKSRRDGPWRDYEQQVTGYPAGMEYDVPRDGGPPVAFDGFEPDVGPNGLLVEAKGTGYEWMVGDDGEFKPNIKGAQDISDELLRQYQVSLQTGIPIEWRVAEPKTAEAIANLIDDAGYGSRIHVVVVPPA